MKTQSLLPEELTRAAVNTLEKQLLKEMGDTILSILLFGSRERGKFIPDSDIDILIIVKEKNQVLINRIFEIADKIESSVLSYRFPLSLHIQSEEEYKRFKNLKSPFIREIEKEGRVVYERKTQS